MKKYGLIGYPLGHSFSMGYFNEKFKNEAINAVYENFEIPDIQDITTVIGSNPDLAGFNVTIPYKEKVMDYLDYIAPEAAEIGAVNVVKVTHNGERAVLKGFNSDVVGFVNSIKPLLRPLHKKALVLGTGGASKAVEYGLRKLGLETIKVSRTEKDNTITYGQVTPELLSEYKVIVNCTPCGMAPHFDECPNLPYDSIDDSFLLYDLIYNPEETLFLRKGKEKDATVKNGLEMLLLQAEEGWNIWNS
ncbi:MAG: shikimate dehydrogenase [Prevotella sp.]|nr:shikimate dehydrogenase [Prevotella sp.]MCI5571921.1 shikimate dehydrogenase [Prevotella sp.]MCI6371421.1 shikimate dehydrogenase [Prevotella sp.]MCI6404319.1 shikimate dehydrogenase [Prevotella sp.]MCI6448732.1 shikimate dehydrogenase [Prevotella sp.]